MPPRVCSGDAGSVDNGGGESLVDSEGQELKQSIASPSFGHDFESGLSLPAGGALPDAPGGTARTWREEPSDRLGSRDAVWPPSWVVSPACPQLGDAAVDGLYGDPFPINNVWHRIEQQVSKRDLRPPSPSSSEHGDWHREDTDRERQGAGFTEMAARFQSLDVRHPHSLAYRRHIVNECRKAQESERRCCPYGSHRIKWLLFAVIGSLMGFLGLALFQTIEFIAHQRTKLIETLVKDARNGDGSATDGMDFAAFAAWWGFSVGVVLLATLVTWFVPSSAGSGVPEVMAHLNGVRMRGNMNLKTLVAKWFGCALAVGCGLPVGPEGPMIHMGAIVGQLCGGGRSRQFHYSFNNAVDRIREPRDRIDYTTAGAAAGVSVAFSAPVGGLLFVSEEVSTHWRPTLAFAVFLCALIAHFMAALFSSQLEGWTLRDEREDFGYFVHEAITLFPSRKGRVMHVLDFVPTLCLGFVGGISGAVFTKLNLCIVRARRSLYVGKHAWLRLVEPAIVITLWCIVAFLVPFGLPCKDKPNGTDPQGIPSLHWVSVPCDDPDTQVSPSASLFWQSGESIVKLLFGADDMLFDYASLATFLVVYLPFSCWAAGLFVSSGIVIPMLVTGGVMGRFAGHLVRDQMHSSQTAGTYAAIGAAAYFAGVSRLTLSLVVIIMELTDETGYLICLMIAVATGKLVADAIPHSHSLYHELMTLRNIPFLDRNVLEEGLGKGGRLVCYRASEVMSPEVRCIRRHTRIRDLALLLDRRFWSEQERHQAFPVVDDDNHFIGLIRRQQLHTVMVMEAFKVEPGAGLGELPVAHGLQVMEGSADLWRQQMRVEDELFVHTGEDGVNLCTPPALPERAYKRQVDLTEHIDTSALSVSCATSLQTVYDLFVSVALRHLVVVDNENRVCGMITRKDLLPGVVKEQLGSDGTRTFLNRTRGSQLHKIPHAYKTRASSRTDCMKSTFSMTGRADTDWEYLGISPGRH
eukprot:TRINITY_DN14364_c0_g1_i1.p1 TRINITY_DN14364_c0_g1~~TRINITY_DN14364_c0_g1_i1.p1  ORF type:complete len:991 (+),score=152.67 TRINITY_DN14364_c0_g1_i1:47-2974(+)